MTENLMQIRNKVIKLGKIFKLSILAGNNEIMPVNTALHILDMKTKFYFELFESEYCCLMTQISEL